MKWILAAVVVFVIVSPRADPARAETATALVTSDTAGQYKTIKSLVAASLKASHMALAHDQQAKTLDLYYCAGYTEIAMPIGKNDKVMSRLMAVAFDTEIYRASLLSVGYPASVWRDGLAAREQQGLSSVALPRDDTGALKRFAAVLNAYRDQGHQDLPRVVVDGGCGAGGVQASFATDPPGGRVLLVPKMYYALCKAQGIDPNDDTRCDFWHEVFRGQKPEVSGDYLAKLVWKDHSVIRSFSASALDEGFHPVILK